MAKIDEKKLAHILELVANCRDCPLFDACDIEDNPVRRCSDVIIAHCKQGQSKVKRSAADER